MADETGTTYVIERRIDAWTMLADADPLPEGTLVWATVGEQKAHGAGSALTRWGEAQGVKFVDGRYRAIPAGNIHEDDLEGETKTRLKRKKGGRDG